MIVPLCPICQASGGFHDAAPHAGSLIATPPGDWCLVATGPTDRKDGSYVATYRTPDGRTHEVMYA